MLESDKPSRCLLNTQGNHQREMCGLNTGSETPTNRRTLIYVKISIAQQKETKATFLGVLDAKLLPSKIEQAILVYL